MVQLRKLLKTQRWKERILEARSMLRIEHLSVWYDVTEVIRDVSLEVPSNSIVALMGGNGAGKSTILNTLSGLLQPRHGTITIDDKPMANFHPQDMVKAGVVQVPQGRFVWPGMSVQDNLLLGASIRSRREKNEIRKDMDDVFQMFPILDERRKGLAANLSGGEQQRVALARSIISKPKLLLLDEPFSNLDLSLREEIRDDTLHLLQKFNISVIIVTHDPFEAMFISNKIYILKQNGSVVQFGSPNDLCLLYTSPSPRD